MLEWNEELETGVDMVDSQHKQIIQRINYSVYCYENGKSEQELSVTLEFLLEYIRVHFNDEERLQRNCDYLYYPEHRADHVEFIGKVEEMILRMYKEGATQEIVRDTNRMMIQWFLKHIQGMDMEFAVYYRQWQKQQQKD